MHTESYVTYPLNIYDRISLTMTNLYRPSGDLFNQQSSLHCRTPSESLPGWSDLTGVFVLYCLELHDGHPFLKTYTWLAINRMMIPNLMWCLGGNPQIDAMKNELLEIHVENRPTYVVWYLYV